MNKLKSLILLSCFSLSSTAGLKPFFGKSSEQKAKEYIESFQYLSVCAQDTDLNGAEQFLRSLAWTNRYSLRITNACQKVEDSLRQASELIKSGQIDSFQDTQLFDFVIIILALKISENACKISRFHK